LDVAISQLSNQRTHCLQIIIDTSQKHALITQNDTFTEQLLSRLSANPAKLTRMVEMRMNSNLLSHLAALLRKTDKLVGPAVLGIESAGRGNTEALCGDAEATDVWD
jgi:hypothetical protein